MLTTILILQAVILILIGIHYILKILTEIRDMARIMVAEKRVRSSAEDFANDADAFSSDDAGEEFLDSLRYPDPLDRHSGKE